MLRCWYSPSSIPTLFLAAARLLNESQFTNINFVKSAHALFHLLSLPHRPVLIGIPRSTPNFPIFRIIYLKIMPSYPSHPHRVLSRALLVVLISILTPPPPLHLQRPPPLRTRANHTHSCFTLLRWHLYRNLSPSATQTTKIKHNSRKQHIHALELLLNTEDLIRENIRTSKL